MKKPPELSYPYLVQKHNSIKTTLYYGPKKSKGCLSWGKGGGVGRIGVGLEVKLFLHFFGLSTTGLKEPVESPIHSEKAKDSFIVVFYANESL